MTRYVILTPGLRRISKRFKNNWIHEYNPLCDISLVLYQARQLILSDRTRMQYIPSHDAKEERHMIFRNCLELTSLSQRKKSSFHWHASHEVFFQKSKGWFENRSIIGFLIPRNKQSFLDIYYLYLLKKEFEEKWKSQNIAGIKAEFKF